MISFALSEEQSIAQSTAREFAHNVLRPLAKQVDDAQSIPVEVLDQLWGLGVVQALAANDEGHTESAIFDAILMEELGWADAVFAVAVASPLAFVRAIVEQGSEQQKETLLPLFLGERYRGAAVVMAEPGFFSGMTKIATTAVQHDGGYRLNGAKLQVPLAGNCDYFLAICAGDGDLDAFIVPSDRPGVKIKAPEGNLGLTALGLATVEFEDVQLGAEMRLGGNRGCDVQRLVDCARTGSSSILTGMCRGVYEHISAYAKERVAHGSALARKQSVAFRLVDMYVETEAMRWMSWRAATHLDKNGAATRSATLAHIYATEQAAWITDEGVQLMGGHGFMRANPVERWYRNAKTLSMLDGIASV